MGRRNSEDEDFINAEKEADPERWKNYHMTKDGEQPSQKPEASEEVEQPREEEEEERPASIKSTSSNGDQSTRQRHRPSMATRSTTQDASRMEEMIENYLDRHPTAVKRIQDHRLQHSHTVGSTRGLSKDGEDLPPFGGDKPYPPPLPDKEEYIVEFDGHEDPLHAQNWPLKKKLLITAVLIFDAFCATFASAIFSPAASYVDAAFGVGMEVGTLGTSLFILGYAVGPVIFAPLSELYGRRLPIVIAMFAFGIFNIAVAVAKDIQTVMICRFFAGLFGSCPLTVVAAVYSDMYDNASRGLAVATFSATVICGPLLAPFIGGFITSSYLTWRWNEFLPAILAFSGGILSFIFQKESYGPVILVSKAADLRRRTKNWGIHAKQEEVEVDFRELISKNLSRPLRILFTEPIVLFVTIYMSFIYGILYLSLTAYEIVFGEIYGFAPGVSGLPYFGMIIGALLGYAAVCIGQPSYAKKLKANNDIPVPEWRMPLPMVGGILFAGGLFWFGWTGFLPTIPWIVPTLAGLFIGFGIYTVFLQCLNYIIDSYLMFAASAIAANTIMRSIFGGVFPLFASYMFKGIGINWGMTFLGCLASVFIPMPFLFHRYGRKIRMKSKFAPAIDVEQDEKKDEESKGGGSGDDNNGRSDSDEKDKKDE